MLPAICVVTGVVLAAGARRLLSGRLCRLLGRISFPLYLFQLPLILSFGCWFMLTLLSRLDMAWAALLMFAATSLATILIAWLMTAALERLTLVAAGLGSAVEALWLQQRMVAKRRLPLRRAS